MHMQAKETGAQASELGRHGNGERYLSPSRAQEILGPIICREIATL